MRRNRKVFARRVTWQDSAFAPAMAGIIQIALVALASPPIASASKVETVVHSWWMRAGGYRSGRIFGSAL